MLSQNPIAAQASCSLGEYSAFNQFQELNLEKLVDDIALDKIDLLERSVDPLLTCLTKSELSTIRKTVYAKNGFNFGFGSFGGTKFPFETCSWYNPRGISYVVRNGGIVTPNGKSIKLSDKDKLILDKIRSFEARAVVSRPEYRAYDEFY
jgi:hypothetical protein